MNRSNWANARSKPSVKLFILKHLCFHLIWSEENKVLIVMSIWQICTDVVIRFIHAEKSETPRKKKNHVSNRETGKCSVLQFYFISFKTFIYPNKTYLSNCQTWLNILLSICLFEDNIYYKIVIKTHLFTVVVCIIKQPLVY